VSHSAERGTGSRSGRAARSAFRELMPTLLNTYVARGAMDSLAALPEVGCLTGSGPSPGYVERSQGLIGLMFSPSLEAA